MGQRLNLSINKNGKVLANCYYHWSGYTNSAMEKARQALDILEEQEGEIGVKEVILALKETGAGIDAKNAQNYVEPDKEIHRDDGIIATTEEDIKAHMTQKTTRLKILRKLLIRRLIKMFRSDIIDLAEWIVNNLNIKVEQKKLVDSSRIAIKVYMEDFPKIFNNSKMQEALEAEVVNIIFQNR